MTVTLEDVQVVMVDLSCPAPLEGCTAFAHVEYGQGFYANPEEPLSVVQFPDTGHLYERGGVSRVVRENANRARRLGYHHRIIDRSEWEDDIHAIRSSAPRRQGRPMPRTYMDRQSYGQDVPPACLRHGHTVHGVIGTDGHLAGYVQIAHCGEIARCNTIIGHADKLGDRVMWLLMLETFKWHIDNAGAQFGLYYTHNSGHGDGLRYWKERFGMRATEATWVMP